MTRRVRLGVLAGLIASVAAGCSDCDRPVARDIRHLVVIYQENKSFDGYFGIYPKRLPLLLVSPFAKQNHVSSELIDQSSILRFIEDRWLDGERISDVSFDRFAGSITDLFASDGARATKLILDPDTGTAHIP